MFLQGLQETIDYLACSGLQKEKIGPLRCGASWKYVLGQRITTSKKLLSNSNTSTFTPQKFAQLKSFFHGIKEKPSRICSPDSTRTEGHEKYVTHFRLKSQFPLSPSLNLWISRAWRQRKFFLQHSYTKNLSVPQAKQAWPKTELQKLYF